MTIFYASAVSARRNYDVFPVSGLAHNCGPNKIALCACAVVSSNPPTPPSALPSATKPLSSYPATTFHSHFCPAQSLLETLKEKSVS